MRIQENISLEEYNTFGIDVRAAFFAKANSISDLKNLLQHPKHPETFILGGGSNLLLVNDLNALVIQMNIKGIQIESEDENHAQVRVMGGENWHEFVLWCIQNGYGGYENLSLIPGLVGTAPIQNIGAYGVELKDHFVSCQVLDKRSLELSTLSAKKCEFGYRDSIFKSKEKGNYIICSVLFKLSKKNHDLKLTYGDIQKVIDENGWKPSIESVSKAVVSIRKSKLPNPKELGNSGSFFKNPIIPIDVYHRLLAKHPKIPHYPISKEYVKVPAGWLIEQAGLKGYTQGRVGVHKNQALVLVNYGGALGIEVYELALYVMETIQEKFGIKLEPEVRIIA